MKFKNRHNPVHNVDGKMVWESRSVAVNCVVLAESEENLYVLIGQRGSGAPDSRGLYNIPSGYLDYDESGTEAVYREVWEETGLYLPDQKIIINDLDNPWLVNTKPTENRQNVSHRHGCVISVEEGNLPVLTYENSEPNEVSDLKWCPINEIGQYQFAFNHDTVIRNYVDLIGF